MHINYEDDYTVPRLSPHMSLPDLGDDLTRLLERHQHLRRLLPPLSDVFALAQQTLDLIRLVQAGHKFALEIFFDKVHHETHYSLK